MAAPEALEDRPPPKASLYARLYKAKAEHKSQREDFLTEALGDLLERLTPQQRVNFCSTVLLKRADRHSTKDWSRRALAANPYWATQFVIPGGVAKGKRPDMVLFAKEGNPILVVENKISAPLLSHEGDERKIDPEDLNQLRSYGKWLNESSRPNPGLVLLAHRTQAPTNFTKPGIGAYGVNLRATCTWSEVYRWLRDAAPGNTEEWAGVPKETQYLMSELGDFLEGENMADNQPTANDFAALRLLLVGEGWTRLQAAMRDIHRSVGKFFSGWRPITKPPEILGEAKDGFIWDYFTQENKKLGHLEIVWGVWFGAKDSLEFSGYAPMRSGAFIYVTIEGTRPVGDWPRKISSKFPKWAFSTSTSDETIAIQLIEISALYNSDEGFGPAFWTWLEPRMPEALQIVRARSK